MKLIDAVSDYPIATLAIFDKTIENNENKSFPSGYIWIRIFHLKHREPRPRGVRSFHDPTILPHKLSNDFCSPWSTALNVHQEYVRKVLFADETHMKIHEQDSGTVNQEQNIFAFHKGGGYQFVFETDKMINPEGRRRNLDGCDRWQTIEGRGSQAGFSQKISMQETGQVCDVSHCLRQFLDPNE
jgi:hypothetical protein